MLYSYIVYFPSYHCRSAYRYRWAFVPEVNVNHYSGPQTALIEGEQDCIPHVVKVLEGILQRFGVNFTLLIIPVYTFDGHYNGIIELI